MWRFVILYNSKDDYFDFRVVPGGENLASAALVYSGFNRQSMEEAQKDLQQLYQALQAIQTWSYADAIH